MCLLPNFSWVTPEQIKAGFDKSRAVFGRQENFQIMTNPAPSFWLKILLVLAKP